MAVKANGEKRRMTIYLEPELEDFLRRYTYENRVTTINKAVISILESERLNHQTRKVETTRESAAGGEE